MNVRFLLRIVGMTSRRIAGINECFQSHCYRTAQKLFRGHAVTHTAGIVAGPGGGPLHVRDCHLILNLNSCTGS